MTQEWTELKQRHQQNKRYITVCRRRVNMSLTTPTQWTDSIQYNLSVFVFHTCSRALFNQTLESAAKWRQHLILKTRGVVLEKAVSSSPAILTWKLCRLK